MERDDRKWFRWVAVVGLGLLWDEKSGGGFRLPSSSTDSRPRVPGAFPIATSLWNEMSGGGFPR